jgi:hypothetical protein
MRLLILVAVALTGCLKQEATFTATVLDASAKGYVIEVKTTPGLKVHVESTEVGYRLIEKGKATGEPFSINRDGVDEEIVALDAHTGKELGRKTFSADEDQCPASRWTGSGTFEARPKPAEVTAWLSGL